MSTTSVLQRFGLTEAEVKIYLELIKSGDLTATNLSRKTSMNRTFAYDRLKKLAELGLVSTITKDTKKYFKAAEPKQLLEVIKEQEEQIGEIIPELEKLRQPSEEEHHIEVFSSKKGVRTALNDSLSESKEILLYGSLVKFEKYMDEYYRIWNQRRIKGNIKLKILTDKEIPLKLSEIDLLGEEESTTTTFTFKDKTVIVLWADVPIALSIKSSKIAKDQRTFFETIWDRDIKIYNGVEGIRKGLIDLVSTKSKTLYGYGGSQRFANIYGVDFANKWQEIRKKNKINSKIIDYDEPDSRKYFNIRAMEHEGYLVRFLDKTICGPSCILLTNELIVDFLYTEKQFRIIVSKNKEMIAVHKKHFEELWKLSKT